MKKLFYICLITLPLQARMLSEEKNATDAIAKKFFIETYCDIAFFKPVNIKLPSPSTDLFSISGAPAIYLNKLLKAQTSPHFLYSLVVGYTICKNIDIGIVMKHSFPTFVFYAEDSNNPVTGTFFTTSPTQYTLGGNVGLKKQLLECSDYSLSCFSDFSLGVSKSYEVVVSPKKQSPTNFGLFCEFCPGLNIHYHSSLDIRLGFALSYGLAKGQSNIGYFYGGSSASNFGTEEVMLRHKILAFGPSFRLKWQF